MSILTIPPGFTALVDDAAIFPPGLAPLPDAVVAHAEHLAAPHGALVGPFVVDGARLDALVALVAHDGVATSALAVSVVVPAPAELGGVVARARAGGLELAGLEVKLDLTQPLAPQVADVAAAAPAGVATYVEVPRPTSPEWPAVLDAVAAHGLRLKLRTGGTEAAAFPSEAEVATWVHAAVTRGVPFKCTAGLHHAVRHTGPRQHDRPGFEHHGYLNVLLATARADAGAEPAEVAAVLAERSPRALADAVAADPGVADARRWFTSYGSCSVHEPLEDLEALDLITRSTTSTPNTTSSSSEGPQR